MKKTFIIGGLCALLPLLSCSKEDELRSDIDDLNSRLDVLLASVPQINSDLETVSEMFDGKIAITEYTVNEYGDYTVKFSDGGSMTIYSGEMEEEIPKITVGEDGWYYTQGGESHPLLDADGNPAPVSGSTPQIRVNERGFWEYSFDGVTWNSGFGSALPNTGSIFDDVYPSEDGSGLVFKWHVGDQNFEKEIKLYGGLDLSIDFGSETLPLALDRGETVTFPATQTNVAEIVIETTSLSVKIEDGTPGSITITAPDAALDTKIFIKIFSDAGYCRVVSIPVVVG